MNPVRKNIHPVRNDSSGGNKDRQSHRTLIGNTSNGAGRDKDKHITSHPDCKLSNGMNRQLLLATRLLSVVVGCLLLGGLFLYGQEKGGKEIEITNLLVRQMPKRDNKVKGLVSIEFTGKSVLKPQTILESHLIIKLRTLLGEKEIALGKRVSSIDAKQRFTEKFNAENKVFPPSKYLLTTLPANRQRHSGIVFTKEEKQKITCQYPFYLGTPAEHIFFLEDEHKDLNQFLDTVRNVYENIDKLVEESLEKNRLPDDDDAFKKWLSDNQKSIIDIIMTVEITTEDDFLTYSPLSYKMLREICYRFSDNFNSLEKTVTYASQGITETPGGRDTISSKLIIYSEIISKAENMEKLMTKESVFALATFLSLLSERFSDTYEKIINRPNSLDKWIIEQKLFQLGLDEYDRAITEMKPAVAEIWQTYKEKLAIQAAAVKEQLALYYQLVAETPEQSTIDKINELTQQIKNTSDALKKQLMN